ncbi:MAG: hypothetical protein U0M04_07145 [Christensenellales bacterium]|nr:hypothetical protein [Christensenellales bacterium]
MSRADLFWQIYLNLEHEVLTLSKYVEFADNQMVIDKKTGQTKIVLTESQLSTYSSHIADLLVRCCVEIEAISKELYFSNGGTKWRGASDVYFDRDCIGLLNQKWNVSQKVVVVTASNFNFCKDENRVLKPLHNAHVPSKTYWSKNYQAVKHDRYNNLHLGNIKALLQALAALYLLNIYYKDIKISTKYPEYRSIDMAFGSKIFSIKLPSEKNVLNVINNQDISGILREEESPYILKYTDQSCKIVREDMEKSRQQQAEMLQRQPELFEPEFLMWLEKARQIEESNPNKRVILEWEICKYRLSKKVPMSLPFEERKKAFVNTTEWKNYVKVNKQAPKENELNETNLQEVIERTGLHAGVMMSTYFYQGALRNALNDTTCELVLDKGNVKYDI